jgi:hypothetical protein
LTVIAKSLRKQLFADWYKYMLCVYPPEGNRDQYPNHDEVKYFIEKNDLIPLQQRIAKNNALNFQRSQAFTNLYQAVPVQSLPQKHLNFFQHRPCRDFRLYPAGLCSSPIRIGRGNG